MLNVVDGFAREPLAIRVGRRLKSADVVDVLSDLFNLRGVPRQIRSENGTEFIDGAGLGAIAAVGARTTDIHRTGQPLENGFCAGFNARLGDAELFNSLLAAR